jgi:hypothetical protein
MIGVLHLFGQIGQIAFSLIAAYLILKPNMGMKAPFRICAFYDVCLCVIGTILALCGKLRKKI